MEKNNIDQKILKEYQQKITSQEDQIDRLKVEIKNSKMESK